MEIDPLEASRISMVLMTAVVFILSATRYMRSFRQMLTGPRLYFAASLCFFVTVAWDTMDMLADHADFSLRMLPYSVGLVLSFIYLSEPFSSARRRLGSDSLTPESDEILNLRTENAELKDRLYLCLQDDNSAKLRVMSLETTIENLKCDRKFIREGQEHRDADRADVRTKAREGIDRQDEEDLSPVPFNQDVRDRKRSDDRRDAVDEIDRQDREDSE